MAEATLHVMQTRSIGVWYRDTTHTVKFWPCMWQQGKILGTVMMAHSAGSDRVQLDTRQTYHRA